MGGGVILTSTGQIVAVGNSHTDIVLARYNADGSLDSTFGQGGKVVTPFAQVEYTDALIQQADGKLIVVGSTSPDITATNEAWQLVRYNANGSLDTTFGSGGIVNLPVMGGGPENAAIYPVAGGANDGKIVVVGMASDPGGAIVRLNPDGTLDSTFGTGGVVRTPRYNAVTLAADGKPIVAGGSLLARYNPDGSPDGSFGTGGTVTTTVADFWGVALQSNGDIVTVGRTSGPISTADFLVARYLPSEPQISSFTASPNAVPSGSSTTLTASNISDANPGATVTQVSFYVDSNADGKLEPGTDTLLGTGTPASPGVWTLNYTASLASGSYTLFAQAKDSDGVLGDPFALTLTVQ
jgi:uncharacterized delta-60 repeat protein